MVNPLQECSGASPMQKEFHFFFDRVPFVCIGTINYQCHQGNDVDKKTKIRRAKERDEKEVIRLTYLMYAPYVQYV